MLVSVIFFRHVTLQAQCTTDGGSGNGQYPSSTIALNTTCVPTTVTSAAYTGEYSRVSGAGANTYTFSSSVNTDFITVTDVATNTAIVWGVTPVSFTFAAAPGDLYIYRHDNSSCAYANGQTSRTITVQCTGCAPPSGGTTTAGTPSGGGCPSFTSALSVTSGPTGTSYTWESSPDGSTWTVLSGATASTYTATVTATTQYRRNTISGSCVATSTPVTVTYLPLAGGTTAASATSGTGCPSFTSTLSVTGSFSGGTYQWQSSPDGVTFSNISGATAATYVATVTASTQYQRISTCSGVDYTSTPIAITFISACPATSVQDGDWDNPATWGGTVPNTAGGCIAAVAVTVNHNVTVTGSTCQATTVTIASGKTLTIDGGTLTMGCASSGGTTGNSNKLLTVNGTLTISSGTLNVNGAVSIASTGAYNQTGGTLNIDPNDGTSAGSYSGTSFAITSNLITATGGAINLLDPPYTTSTSNRSMTYSHTSLDAVFGTGCTITLGGGDDTNTANTYGFTLDGNLSTGTMEFGSVVVNSGRASAKRMMNATLSSSNNTKIRNLTINAGSEVLVTSGPLALVSSIANPGSLVNNGFLTVNTTTANKGLVFCGDYQYSGGAQISESDNSFTWSGSGFFKKATTDADPSSADDNVVNALAIYSSNASGLVLSAPLGANLLTLGGHITSTASNIFTLGSDWGATGHTTTYSTITITKPAGVPPNSSITTVTGMSDWLTYNGSSSTGQVGKWVKGPVRRWYNGTGSGFIMPCGISTGPQCAGITFTTLATANAGRLVATPITGDAGGTCNLSCGPTNNIVAVSPTLSWDVSPSGSYGVNYSGAVYTAEFHCNGFTKIDGATLVTVYGDMTVVKRPSGGGAWACDGTNVTGAASGTGFVIKRTGISTGFSRFAAGGSAVALPIELKSIYGKINATSNIIYWETGSEANVNSFQIERSIDGTNNWVSLSSIAPQNAANGAKYNFEDRAPIPVAYYRLHSIDNDGYEQMSNIITLVRESHQFGIATAFPIPTSDDVNIQYESLEEADITLRITDLTGHLVAEQLCQASKGINTCVASLAGLNAGVYLITINNGTTASAPVRVVKQ